MTKDAARKRSAAVAAGVAAVPLAHELLAFTSSNLAPRARSQPQPAQPAQHGSVPKSKPSSRGLSSTAGAATLTGLAAMMGHGAKKRGASGTSGTTKSINGLTVCMGQPSAVLEKSTEAGDPEKVLEQYIKDLGGKRILRKWLIANNGMAATKAILSLRQWAYLELGLDNAFEFVVMATPEDLEANAEFIRLANTYIEVPGGKNVNNYANVDLIVEIAKSQGVDAVWPGWGHASENPELPMQLKELGITFVGPTSPVMSVLGDKIAANILAQTAGVPSIPWSGDGLQADLGPDGTIPKEIFDQGTVSTVEQAKEAVKHIGFPVMIKASEGGGGKGIRMVQEEKDLESSFFQVQNEVPGSPIFMMQLCQGARHIEVQIMGDEYGNAVALNGRDCSTQRRFQKIFEEGPPVVVPRETFLEMERAAQRLTQNIGYIGAGTVEYLYNSKENKFYFLELNPRLQVEHPVTEELTRVNLPATQMLVCSGVPLEKVPQIRRFYGKSDTDKTSPISFLEDLYVYPDRHVIASRITAENPDDGFKPTSGRIERIKFQSSVSCWGYFSIGAKGGIHEYADSQFGHIFAHGSNREEARKALMLSLKNIEVVGEIRNPVEYLVELLQQEAFVANSIDTSWLDGLIKEKSVSLRYNINDVVFYAAVFRAVQNLKAFDEEVEAALAKSQLGPLREMSKMNTFPVEITFEGVKYQFSVSRLGPSLLELSIKAQKFTAQVMAQPDGTFLVSVGKTVMRVMGSDEALGLRLRLDGIGTIMLPTVYDPSELRSEFNGKIVRYLQDDGGQVQEGEPYVELEAMKMIMPIKATATGKVSHVRGAGSIVSAGELLGNLQLSDPSKVKKIVPFDGSFAISADGNGKDRSLQGQLEMVLDGFTSQEEPALMAQKMFSQLPEAECDDVASALVERYLAVEEKFSPLIKEKLTSDQIYAELIAQNKENLPAVASLALAHGQLGTRSEVVLAALRSLRKLNPSPSLMQKIGRLAELDNTGGYGEVVLVAETTMALLSSEPFEDRSASLRALLDTDGPDLKPISGMAASKAGAELLSNLLLDESARVRKNALDALDVNITDHGAGDMRCNFKFQFPGTADADAFREGHIKVVTDFAAAREALKEDICMDNVDGNMNTMKVIVTSPGDTAFDKMSSEMEGLLKSNANLQSVGIREVGLVVSNVPHALRYASFMGSDGWKENLATRDMKPSLPNVLEVYRLAEDYKLEKVMPPVGRNSQVYIGTPVDAVPSRTNPSTIFARMIKHSMRDFPDNEKAWTDSLENLLLNAVDEVERARLNPKIGYGPNSNIFAHIVANVDVEPSDAYAQLEGFLNLFVARHQSRLGKMKVDEIVVKIGLGSQMERKKTLRLTASSLTGEYLRTSGALETYDAITGSPKEWFDIKSGEKTQLASAKAKSRLQLRRSLARNAGSTYAPDFLGMLKIELIKKWNMYQEAGGSRKMPSAIFKSTELVLSEDGELKEVDRDPGQHNIGMLAWCCTLQSPEYPEGRDIVLIANDVTHKAGSFGVDEDDLFQKASEYARQRGLPRIHIACNSGARVGLAEELKPFVKAKWTDDDPSKGFDYLYLEEKDATSLPEGAVETHTVTVAGQKHYVIDSIIGEGLKSTQGGIGVENLRGSGLIAGETSKAYNEVFTLSYVTGRSVGIGAYLNRLGQRVIQMVNGPMILTGFSALNKLLGKNVYTSQDQLGGPQVMVPNGVTHQVVSDDTEGVAAILDWLSFVPKVASANPPLLDPVDPVSRDVTFVPSKTPYDPRHMLEGVTTPEGSKLTGFFDAGTFKEYLAGWGRSVIVGRAKLGGIPMGVIAVETRNMDRRIPADPANPASQEVVEPQAGQVWFPDSAFKTATAIRDFNRGENLPLIIFANWRGFSGGTRDMYQEVLKFGAQIVDALVEYKSPVFVYIPPGGELRGGSWVVIDPTINPEQMEMYADVDSRGGILEPPGIVEVKFRAAQQKELMHRLDPELRKYDALLEESSSSEVGSAAQDIEAQIKAREDKLQPLYTQIACEFADLHDRTGRMEAKGVIRKGLEWRRAREFFYWRVKCRLLLKEVEHRIREADADLSSKDPRLSHIRVRLRSFCPRGFPRLARTRRMRKPSASWRAIPSLAKSRLFLKSFRRASGALYCEVYDFPVNSQRRCATEARCLKQAAKSLLTAPLSSSGQWQSDHADAESVLKLCSRGEAQSLLIVPQASLVCKLELGDRNLKYHQQCPRDTAAALPRTEFHRAAECPSLAWDERGITRSFVRLCFAHSRIIQSTFAARNCCPERFIQNASAEQPSRETRGCQPDTCLTQYIRHCRGDWSFSRRDS
eukprot:s129_g13.t2